MDREGFGENLNLVKQKCKTQPSKQKFENNGGK